MTWLISRNFLQHEEYLNIRRWRNRCKKTWYLETSTQGQHYIFFDRSLYRKYFIQWSKKLQFDQYFNQLNYINYFQPDWFITTTQINISTFQESLSLKDGWVKLPNCPAFFLLPHLHQSSNLNLIFFPFHFIILFPFPASSSFPSASHFHLQLINK